MKTSVSFDIFPCPCISFVKINYWFIGNRKINLFYWFIGNRKRNVNEITKMGRA